MQYQNISQSWINITSNTYLRLPKLKLLSDGEAHVRGGVGAQVAPAASVPISTHDHEIRELPKGGWDREHYYYYHNNAPAVSSSGSFWNLHHRNKQLHKSYYCHKTPQTEYTDLE